MTAGDPCSGLHPGTSVGEPCGTCAHVAAAHTWPGAVCSVCSAVAEVRSVVIHRIEPQDHLVIRVDHPLELDDLSLLIGQVAAWSGISDQRIAVLMAGYSIEIVRSEGA